MVTAALEVEGAEEVVKASMPRRAVLLAATDQQDDEAVDDNDNILFFFEESIEMMIGSCWIVKARGMDGGQRCCSNESLMIL